MVQMGWENGNLLKDNARHFGQCQIRGRALGTLRRGDPGGAGLVKKEKASWRQALRMGFQNCPLMSGAGSVVKNLGDGVRRALLSLSALPL